MFLLYNLKRILYKIIGFIKFGPYIEIEGDPRKIKVGNKSYIEKGVQFRVVKGTITIGDNCVIRRGVILSTEGGNIRIGDESTINPYSVIYGDGNTFIGKGVRIAAHSIIVPANHKFKNKDIYIKDQGLTKKGISIMDDVWIGAGVTILDGVKINKGAVVAAGAVVTKEIPEYALTMGIPAKIVDYRK